MLFILAWLVLIVVIACTFAVMVFLAMLPGMIAKKRKHPWEQAVTIAGCHGVRVLARGRKRDGSPAVLEFLAVARDDAQFTFGIRALAEHYESFREPFTTAVSTFRFSVAR